MRTGISFTVSLADRLRLQAIVAAPRSLQKHVWRAHIILLSDDGLGTMAIRAATGKSKTCIWRWQERFMMAGVDGLLHDKTRPPGVAPVPADRVAEIVRLTQAPPPHEATHWTLRAMAKTPVWRLLLCRGFGSHTVSARIAGGNSSSPTIRPSLRSSLILSACMSRRPPTRSCFRSMKSPKFRRLIARSPACQ